MYFLVQRKLSEYIMAKKMYRDWQTVAKDETFNGSLLLSIIFSTL